MIGVDTETFESFSANQAPPLNIAFTGAGNAQILNTDPNPQDFIDVENWGGGTNGAGRFAISGQQYLEVDSSGFVINFDNPNGIAAFGFYGTDIGDFGGALSLTLTAMDGTTVTLPVPDSIGSGTGTPQDGSVIYFGFFDTAKTYKSIAFNNDQGGVDNFGFDDFSVGSLAQVQPGPTVPEPSSLITLAGAGLLAVVALRRRQAR